MSVLTGNSWLPPGLAMTTRATATGPQPTQPSPGRGLGCPPEKLTTQRVPTFPPGCAGCGTLAHTHASVRKGQLQEWWARRFCSSVCPAAGKAGAQRGHLQSVWTQQKVTSCQHDLETSATLWAWLWLKRQLTRGWSLSPAPGISRLQTAPQGQA